MQINKLIDLNDYIIKTVKQKLSDRHCQMTSFKIQSKDRARKSVQNTKDVFAIRKAEQMNINFPFNRYPFPNQSINSEQYRTIFQCHISKERLQRIANLRLKNMIGLKKIVRLKMKQNKEPEKPLIKKDESSKTKPVENLYLFCFQKVQYSLERVFQMIVKKDSRWMNKFNLSREEIKRTLAHFVAQLYKEGIVLFIEFQHIGVDSEGVLKVYVPPNVLFDECQYNSKTKLVVVKCLDQVLKQIDAKYSQGSKSKRPSQYLNSNDVSLKNEVVKTQQSVLIDGNFKVPKNSTNQVKFKSENRELLFHDEKSFNEQDRIFMPSSSLNIDNLKIHKEMRIKFENQNLSSIDQERIQKQNKSRILNHSQQKNKIQQLISQIEQIRRKFHEKFDHNPQKDINKSRSRQKVFDKIRNSINNEAKGQSKRTKQRISIDEFRDKINKLVKKKKTSLSAINFYTGTVPYQKNINCVNIYHHNKCHQQSEYVSNDDGVSIDTYEMQIGNNYQIPKISFSVGFKNLLGPKVKHRQSFQVPSNVKEEQKATDKMRFCESAGVKSFEHITNLLKPQFQPKKSNIFQEPQVENEQDSKKSTSLRKSIGRQIFQKSLHKKNQQYSQFKQSDHSSNHKNTMKEVRRSIIVDQYESDLKNLFSSSPIFFQKIPQKQHNQQRVTFPILDESQKNPEIEHLKSLQTTKQMKPKKRSFEMLLKKVLMEQKLRKAMQRTRKAINFLNQARIGTNITINDFDNNKK